MVSILVVNKPSENDLIEIDKMIKNKNINNDFNSDPMKIEISKDLIYDSYTNERLDNTFIVFKSVDDIFYLIYTNLDNSIPLNEPLSENLENAASLDSSRISEDSAKIENNEKHLIGENSPDNYKNYVLPYYPLKFLNQIMRSIDNKLSFALKIILIIVGLILLIILNGFLVFYIRDQTTFQIELTTHLKNLFRFEKHIFILIYFLMLVIMITLPKTGSLRDFMTSKICMTISRMGFLISCISHMFTFMTFFVFSLKVKLYVPTFIIISFGNFLGFFVLCILLNIITELPLRLIVKKILRIGRKRESIII